MVNLNQYMTLKEAAERLGISRQAVSKAGQAGDQRPAKIRTLQVSRTRLYHRGDVEKYKPRQSNGGKEAGG
jgi:hypothetical protein